MRIEQLKYFVEAVNLKSINKAAEKLYVSQSTMSDALKKLEQEMGKALLYKTYHGVTTTDFGQVFYHTACNILDELEKLDYTTEKHQISGLAHRNQEIRLSVTPELSDHVLPKLIHAIRGQYPQMKLKIMEGDFKENLVNISADKIDCALIAVYEGLLEEKDLLEMVQTNQLEMEVLHKSKVVAVVGANSKLAARKIIGLKEAIKMPMVIYNSSMESTWHERLFATYGQIDVVLLSGSLSLCASYLEQNPETIAFTNANLATTYLKNEKNKLVTIPIKEEEYYSFVFVVRKNKVQENQGLKESFAYILKNL